MVIRIPESKLQDLAFHWKPKELARIYFEQLVLFESPEQARKNCKRVGIILESAARYGA